MSNNTEDRARERELYVIHAEDYEARIQAEADAILSECASSMRASEEFANRWEALEAQRGEIIYFACHALVQHHDTAEVITGRFVIDLIRRAAMLRADHQIGGM